MDTHIHLLWFGDYYPIKHAHADRETIYSLYSLLKLEHVKGSLAALEILEPFPHDPQRCTNLRHCAARRQRVDSIEQQ